MTVAEMHATVLLKIDKVGSYATSNLISGEIDDFINDAIREYVNQQKILLRREKRVDQSSEAQENLRPLINREVITNNISQNTTIDADGFEINLSNLTDYEYYISGKADFGGDWNILKLVSSGYLTDDTQNKYNSPFQKGIPISVEGNKIVGVHPNVKSTPDEAIINYLQTPDYVDLNSSTDTNLPDHTHRDLTDIAAQKIIASLSGQQQRTQQEE